MSDVNQLIETLYKERYGQLIALILQKFQRLSFDAAEDIVQEAFTEAVARWAHGAIPANPSGWLYQTCRNKSINQLKLSFRTSDLLLAKSISIEQEEIVDPRFNDAKLQMLFACCHSHLTPKTQVVMALKYVANLKTENIAIQFGSDPDAIEKMLYRAKQKIKGKSLNFSTDGHVYTGPDLFVIHKIIYLIFNEGYKQSAGSREHGGMLCEEALILNNILLDSCLGNAETKALQALMLFNMARFDGRHDTSGKAIELEHQDRTLWSQPLIQFGCDLLKDSEADVFSPYHLEAAIACVHCLAGKFDHTDWKIICKYYEVLLKLYPNPFTEINYAVALQYDRQNEKAWNILTELNKNPFFNKLPLLRTTVDKYLARVKS